MNPSKCHRLMSMRVISGNLVMCMAMDPPERIKCVPTSSGLNLSLVALTRRVSILMT